LVAYEDQVVDTPSVSQQRVTDLLTRRSQGDDAAVAELTPLVYDELRRLAHRQIGAERPKHTANNGSRERGLSQFGRPNQSTLGKTAQTSLLWQPGLCVESWLVTPEVNDPKSAVAARSRWTWTKQRSCHQRNQRKLSICTIGEATVNS